MTIQIIDNENGTIITGDAEILKRLPEGFEVASVDLKDVRIDAHNLAKAAGYASYNSVDHVKFYATLKQAYIQQQSLAKVKYEPVVDTEPDKPTEETEKLVNDSESTLQTKEK